MNRESADVPPLDIRITDIPVTKETRKLAGRWRTRWVAYEPPRVIHQTSRTMMWSTGHYILERLNETGRWE